MKKLILMTVFSIVGLTTYAQDNGQDQNQNQAETTVAQAQDDFTKIADNELPQTVSDAINNDYPSATLGNAYKNKSDQYKVEVTLEDGTSGSLYFDKDGKSIEM